MAAKRRLSELAKRDGLDNKWCIDCRNPNPQWASLRCCLSLSLLIITHLYQLWRVSVSAVCRDAPWLWGSHQASSCPAPMGLSPSSRLFLALSVLSPWMPGKTTSFSAWRCELSSSSLLLLISLPARWKCTLSRLSQRLRPLRRL